MRFLLICLILNFSFHSLSAQNLSIKPTLVDEFGAICSEDLMARLDTFVTVLNNDATATGYFVVYGGELEGTNLNYIQYLTGFYPEMKKFDASRLTVLRGKNQQKMKIQFWIVPNGASPPIIEKPFVENKITKTILFDKTWADFNRWHGELDIYSNGFYELGCEFSPNVRAFSRVLSSDSNLTGYLIVYTKYEKGIKRGRQIINFALKDLTKNYKTSSNRLKAIYGGNRKEPEIEFWLVPKDGNIPLPAPEKR